jgi:hypothetical protein
MTESPSLDQSQECVISTHSCIFTEAGLRKKRN